MRRWTWTVLAALAAFVAAPLQAAEPLVDADWLHDRLEREDLVVLDIRNAIDGGSQEAFREGHIPGAVYNNYLKAGWRVKRDGVPGQLPPVAKLEKLIGGLGIDNHDHVVVVAGGTSALDMGSATRVYWTFKVLGHDEVSVLNGGHKAYAAKYPLESGPAKVTPGEFTADFRPGLVASRQAVAAALKDGTPLIDNRPEQQYRGAAKHPAATKPGTLPGARNVPESKLTVDGGTFVSAERVAELLDTAKLDTGGAAITFCNTGHWASLGWFAASEILGNKQVRLYDGSMTDWTRHGGPVARLAEGGE